MALSTLFQVLLRALVSIKVQLKWLPPLDDAITMYFPADPATLHSFPPCLLYQQRGILFIVLVKKYRLLFIRLITGIFGRGIGTLMVRVYRCGHLVILLKFIIQRYLGWCAQLVRFTLNWIKDASVVRHFYLHANTDIICIIIKCLKRIILQTEADIYLQVSHCHESMPEPITGRILAEGHPHRNHLPLHHPPW